MATNKPKGQHFVPKNYLAGFVDPKTPANYEPYVWIFEKNNRKGYKKSPSNIFKKTDLYTLHLKTGTNDYSIEETLSSIEARFATVYREKIKQHIPLNEEEHVYLCVFVSVMLQRTLRHRDSLNNFIDQLIKQAELAELQLGLEPKKSNELKEYKKNFFQLGILQSLPDITELLLNMGLAFLCAEKGSKFVTSDDPCNLFNPDLQWQKFYSPGLKQQRVQVTLPLSPDIMLCLSWSNLRGYISWNKKQVDEANRMIVGHCYKEFVSNNPKTKRLWFRRYPIDFFFIIKILKHKYNMFLYTLKQWRQNKRYVRK